MQKILMNYYEYDKERHIIMVDVYLLPANEGDCLWVRYGKKEGTRHNIIIDGGVESNGGDIASIIENIQGKPVCSPSAIPMFFRKGLSFRCSNK